MAEVVSVAAPHADHGHHQQHNEGAGGSVLSTVTVGGQRFDMLEGTSPVYGGASLELRLACKSLGKRHATTKLKGIAEMERFLQAEDGQEGAEGKEGQGEAWMEAERQQMLKDFVPHFAYLYIRNWMDNDARVRTGLNSVLLHVAQLHKRSLGVVMPALIAPWCCCQSDPRPEVASAARSAFERAIPAKKRPQVLAFFAPRIVAHLAETLAKSPEQLGDLSVMTRDEVDLRYNRVQSCCLYATAQLIRALPDPADPATDRESAQGARNALIETLLTERLWRRMSAKRPAIRLAMYQLCSSTCAHIPEVFTAHLLANADTEDPAGAAESKGDGDGDADDPPPPPPTELARHPSAGRGHRAALALAAMFDDKDVANHAAMWECALAFLRCAPSLLMEAHVDLRQNMAKHLTAQIRHGFHGTEAESLPNLLPLLASLPATVTGREAVHQHVFDALAARMRLSSRNLYQLIPGMTERAAAAAAAVATTHTAEATKADNATAAAAAAPAAVSALGSGASGSAAPVSVAAATVELGAFFLLSSAASTDTLQVDAVMQTIVDAVGLVFIGVSSRGGQRAVGRAAGMFASLAKLDRASRLGKAGKTPTQWNEALWLPLTALFRDLLIDDSGVTRVRDALGRADRMVASAQQFFPPLLNALRNEFVRAAAHSSTESGVEPSTNIGLLHVARTVLEEIVAQLHARAAPSTAGDSRPKPAQVSPGVAGAWRDSAVVSTCHLLELVHVVGTSTDLGEKCMDAMLEGWLRPAVNAMRKHASAEQRATVVAGGARAAGSAAANLDAGKKRSAKHVADWPLARIRAAQAWLALLVAPPEAPDGVSSARASTILHESVCLALDASWLELVVALIERLFEATSVARGTDARESVFAQIADTVLAHCFADNTRAEQQQHSVSRVVAASVVGRWPAVLRNGRDVVTAQSSSSWASLWANITLWHTSMGTDTMAGAGEEEKKKDSQDEDDHALLDLVVKALLDSARLSREQISSIARDLTTFEQGVQALLPAGQSRRASQAVVLTWDALVRQLSVGGTGAARRVLVRTAERVGHAFQDALRAATAAVTDDAGAGSGTTAGVVGALNREEYAALLQMVVLLCTGETSDTLRREEFWAMFGFSDPDLWRLALEASVRDVQISPAHEAVMLTFAETGVAEFQRAPLAFLSPLGGTQAGRSLADLLLFHTYHSIQHKVHQELQTRAREESVRQHAQRAQHVVLGSESRPADRLASLCRTSGSADQEDDNKDDPSDEHQQLSHPDAAATASVMASSATTTATLMTEYMHLPLPSSTMTQLSLMLRRVLGALLVQGDADGDASPLERVELMCDTFDTLLLSVTQFIAGTGVFRSVSAHVASALCLVLDEVTHALVTMVAGARPSEARLATRLYAAAASAREAAPITFNAHNHRVTKGQELWYCRLQRHADGVRELIRPVRVVGVHRETGQVPYYTVAPASRWTEDGEPVSDQEVQTEGEFLVRGAYSDWSLKNLSEFAVEAQGDLHGSLHKHALLAVAGDVDVQPGALADFGDACRRVLQRLCLPGLHWLTEQVSDSSAATAANRPLIATGCRLAVCSLLARGATSVMQLAGLRSDAVAVEFDGLLEEAVDLLSRVRAACLRNAFEFVQAGARHRRASGEGGDRGAALVQLVPLARDIPLWCTLLSLPVMRGLCVWALHITREIVALVPKHSTASTPAQQQQRVVLRRAGLVSALFALKLLPGSAPLTLATDMVAAAATATAEDAEFDSGANLNAPLLAAAMQLLGTCLTGGAAAKGSSRGGGQASASAGVASPDAPRLTPDGVGLLRSANGRKALGHMVSWLSASVRDYCDPAAAAQPGGSGRDLSWLACAEAMIALARLADLLWLVVCDSAAPLTVTAVAGETNEDGEDEDDDNTASGGGSPVLSRSDLDDLFAQLSDQHMTVVGSFISTLRAVGALTVSSTEVPALDPDDDDDADYEDDEAGSTEKTVASENRGEDGDEDEDKHEAVDKQSAEEDEGVKEEARSDPGVESDMDDDLFQDAVDDETALAALDDGDADGATAIPSPAANTQSATGGFSVVSVAPQREADVVELTEAEELGLDELGSGRGRLLTALYKITSACCRARAVEASFAAEALVAKFKDATEGAESDGDEPEEKKHQQQGDEDMALGASSRISAMHVAEEELDMEVFEALVEGWFEPVLQCGLTELRDALLEFELLEEHHEDILAHTPTLRDLRDSMHLSTLVMGQLYVWLLLADIGDVVSERDATVRAILGHVVQRSGVFERKIVLLLRMFPDVTKCPADLHGILHRNPLDMVCARDTHMVLGSTPGRRARPYRGMPAPVAASASGSGAGSLSMLQQVQLLSAYALYRTVRAFPAVSRTWWQGCTKRRLTQQLLKFVEQRASDLLAVREVQIVHQVRKRNDIAAMSGDTAEFSVRASAQTREVVATFVMDETNISLVIAMPLGYPLRVVDISCNSQLGIPEKRWRRYQLSLQRLLSVQDGAILDAVMLWKTNLEREFEGVEPCPICYSILDMKTRKMPTMACPTCHYKFHPTCLYQWFSSSGKNTCVLCQQPF